MTNRPRHASWLMLRVRFHRTGPPAEVLAVEEFEPGGPGPGEVRLRLRAAPVNPADLNYIEGRYGVQPTLPEVPGMEGAGVIEAVGTGVAELALGDAVIGRARLHSWTEARCLPAAELWKIPAAWVDRAPWEQWAQLRINPLTAWRLLGGFTDLQRGDAVLVNAANSGVGRCLLALARERGLTVFGFARREEALAELRGLHPEARLFLDRDEGWNQAKTELAERRTPLACNCVGGDSALAQLKLLGHRGVQVTYGAMARQPARLPAGLMIFKELRLEGLWVTHWQAEAPRAEVDAALGELAGMVADGRLHQPVDAVFPLGEVRLAVARAVEGSRAGKVVLGLAD